MNTIFLVSIHCAADHPAIRDDRSYRLDPTGSQFRSGMGGHHYYYLLLLLLFISGVQGAESWDSRRRLGSRTKVLAAGTRNHQHKLLMKMGDLRSVQCRALVCS